MSRPQLFNEYHDQDSLIAEINEYDADDRDRLAGYYAYDAASENYSSNDEFDADFRNFGDDFFTGHLDILMENGCLFDMREALRWARGYVQTYGRIA